MMRAWIVGLLVLSPVAVLAGETKFAPNAGADSSVPGLSGSIGNDLTYGYLVNEVKTFESMPNWPRYYFSASGAGGYLPEGDDTNPCTEEYPCKGAALMETLMNRHQTIVVLDHDNWGGDDELSAFNGFNLDNTGCGSGAGPLEDTPCAFMVPLRPEALSESRPTFDCSGASSITGLGAAPFTLVDGGGSGYFGRAGVAIDHCPENPGTNGAAASEFVTYLDNQGGGGQGKLVEIGVRYYNVTGSHSHAVRVNQQSAHYLGINTGGSLRDHADFDSDCTGTGCADNDPVPQALCTDGAAATPYDCCDGATPAQCTGRNHFYEMKFSWLTVISEALHHNKSTQWPSSGAGQVGYLSDCVTGPCTHIAIGPTWKWADALTINPGGSVISAGASNLASDNGTSLTAYWARMTVLPFPTGATQTIGLRPFLGGSATLGDVTTVNMFQNTVTGAETGVFQQTQFDTDQATITGECNVFEDLVAAASGDAYLIDFNGNVGATASVIFDFDGTNVYDIDDAAGQAFACHNNEYEGAADVIRDNCLTGPDPDQNVDVNADFFGSTFGGSEGALESGGATVNGDVFDELASQAGCGPGELCDRACTHTFDVPLGETFIPSAVTRANTPIKQLRLGTHYTNVGAR